jgi:hypothetical protein
MEAIFYYTYFFNMIAFFIVILALPSPPQSPFSVAALKRGAQSCLSRFAARFSSSPSSISPSSSSTAVALARPASPIIARSGSKDAGEVEEDSVPLLDDIADELLDDEAWIAQQASLSLASRLAAMARRNSVQPDGRLSDSDDEFLLIERTRLESIVDQAPLAAQGGHDGNAAGCTSTFHTFL